MVGVVVVGVSAWVVIVGAGVVVSVEFWFVVVVSVVGCVVVGLSVSAWVVVVVRVSFVVVGLSVVSVDSEAGGCVSEQAVSNRIEPSKSPAAEVKLSSRFLHVLYSRSEPTL